MKLSLRFKKSEISHWSSRYQVDSMEDFMEKKLRPTIQANKYLTSTQLSKLCKWKTPRTKSRVAKNSEEFIRVVTETAFSTPNEQLRIEVLTLLQGVSWPTASVLLHFGSSEPYPILDFRALWSLGLRVPKQYDFQFWWTYTQFCRHLSLESNVTMRILDRALWQFSKETKM